MAVVVKVPLGFLPATGGRLLVTVEAATVGEAIDALAAAYPDLAGRIRDPGTQGPRPLRRGVKAFVAGTDVKRLDGLATRLRDGDRVDVVAAISGG
jgi:molybdopterin converting factor small subunit